MIVVQSFGLELKFKRLKFFRDSIQISRLFILYILYILFRLDANRKRSRIWSSRCNWMRPIVDGLNLCPAQNYHFYLLSINWTYHKLSHPIFVLSSAPMLHLVWLVDFRLHAHNFDVVVYIFILSISFIARYLITWCKVVNQFGIFSIIFNISIELWLDDETIHNRSVSSFCLRYWIVALKFDVLYIELFKEKYVFLLKTICTLITSKCVVQSTLIIFTIS